MRRQLSQAGDDLGDHVDCVIGFLFRIETAQAETDRAMGQLILHPERLENVAGFGKIRRTRGAARYRDVVQPHQQGFAMYCVPYYKEVGWVVEIDDEFEPERSQDRRSLAYDVGRTGGSSTGECRGAGTVEVTDTSPPETPMRLLEQQVLFFRHGGSLRMQLHEQDDTGVDVGSNETGSARTSVDPGRPGRGRLRPLAAGLAAFAALLLALPLQAEAQKTTFVSNTGQSTDPDVREVGPHGHLWQLQAQQFRTGDNEGGYTLSAIQVRVDDFGSNSRPKVSIYTTSSGNPGTSLYVLTNPATLNDDAINTFRAPANATLEKDTNYFVVFEELGSGSNLRYDLEVTTSNAEDSGKASGWNITNSSRQRSTTATTWSDLAGKLKIAVRGTLPPAISIADASAAENAGHLMFDVTLSRSFQNTVKVDFETISGGTATEGVDYHARRTYTHVILEGDKTAQMGFALIEDTVAAAGETVKVRLSNARVVDAYGNKIKDLDITTAEATGTINAPTTTTTNVPGLTIRIEDATGDEDSGWLVFKVRLSRKHDDYVCYDFETISGGTAEEGTDYSRRPKVGQWVQIGKRVDKPFVRIIDDSVNDNGETVKVKISNARLCNDASQTLSITRAEATGTIRNSDPLPQAFRFSLFPSLVSAQERVQETRLLVQATPSNRAEATPGVGALDFAHFANGEGIISDLVLMNVATHPIRPVLYFYDKEGHPIAAESMVDLTEDLEVTEDGGLSIQTEMEPLEALTISTHGRGEPVTGSVTVLSDGPIGGLLRFDLPGVGAGVFGRNAAYLGHMAEKL